MLHIAEVIREHAKALFDAGLLPAGVSSLHYTAARFQPSQTSPGQYEWVPLAERQQYPALFVNSLTELLTAKWYRMEYRVAIAYAEVIDRELADFEDFEQRGKEVLMALAHYIDTQQQAGDYIVTEGPEFASEYWQGGSLTGVVTAIVTLTGPNPYLTYCDG